MSINQHKHIQRERLGIPKYTNFERVTTKTLVTREISEMGKKGISSEK